MGNKIKVGLSEFWTDEGILHCCFRNQDTSYRFDLDSVNLFINAIDQLCKGKPMPFLIDSRGFRGVFTRESADLVANSPVLEKIRVSEAFVQNSIGIKLVIAFYKRIYEPITPFGVFDDLESAKEYCVESKNEYNGSN